MLQIYITVGVAAYLLGSIPFGYILVKLFLKEDIRQTGSGNIGATNVARSGHAILAVATLLLDSAKGAAAVALTFWYFAWALSHDPVWTTFLGGFAGLCAILGHIFPVWLRFKGGKGVATALGASVLIAPRAVLCAVLIFAVVFFFFRYISVSSVLTAAVFPALAYALPLRLFGHDTRSGELIAILVASSLLVILRHHSNLRRLLNGTEPKFGRVKQAVLSDPLQAEKNA